MDNQDQTFEVMRACLLAGKIMLQSGAETYRVEDTMSRMASAFGIDKTIQLESKSNSEILEILEKLRKKARVPKYQ